MTKNLTTMSQGGHNDVSDDKTMKSDHDHTSAESEHHNSACVCQIFDGLIKTLDSPLYHDHTHDIVQMMTTN